MRFCSGQGNIWESERLIEKWNEARVPYWKPQPEATKTLRAWLKSIRPHVKLDLNHLKRSWKKEGYRSPLSLKEIRKVLDKKISLSLHLGYVHGRLQPSVIGTQGFSDWSAATEAGTRGIDCAPYIEPHGQSKDMTF